MFLLSTQRSMDNLYQLSYLHGSSPFTSPLDGTTWGSSSPSSPPLQCFACSLLGCPPKTSMQTSTSPLFLRSDCATVLLHAVGSCRESGVLIFVQYRSDGMLCVGSALLAAAAGSPGAGPPPRVLPWSLVSSLEPTCMTLSSDARVLAVAMACGDILVLSVDALLLAAEDGCSGVPFPGSRTLEGLPSLAALAAQRSPSV